MAHTDIIRHDSIFLRHVNRKDILVDLNGFHFNGTSSIIIIHILILSDKSLSSYII
jgi:hypothetical protein